MMPPQILKCLIIFTIIYIIICIILDVDVAVSLMLYPLLLLAYAIYCIIVYKETHPTAT